MLTTQPIATEATMLRRTLHERLCGVMKCMTDAADTDRPLTSAFLISKAGDELAACVELALREQNEATARDERIAYLERRLEAALHPRVTY